MIKKILLPKELNDDSSVALHKTGRERKLLSFNLIFICAFIFIIFFYFFSYKQIDRLMSANALVIHTYEVIEATDNVLYLVIDSETHQRGYFITGDRQFLIERDESVAALRKNLKRLKKLTQDNPSQTERVAELAGLIEKRIGLLNQTKQIKERNLANTEGGLNVIKLGQSMSNHIRYLTEEIKSVELTLLTERNRTVFVNTTTANVILMVGNLISLIFLIIAFILFNRELKKRILSEEKGRNTESRLRSILEGAHDRIAAINTEYQYILFNESYQNEFKRLFGVSISLGMSVQDALASIPEARAKLLNAWEAALEGRECTQDIELTHEHKKETYEITSSSIANDKKQIIGAVQIMRNITKRIQEQAKLQEYNEKLNHGMKELQHKNQQITLLVEMSDNLLACASQEELGTVIKRYSQRMLDFSKGILYVMHPSKNFLEAIERWGEPNEQDRTFYPDQCWGIRRGRLHHVKSAHAELICNHIKKTENNTSYLCVPLMAQNDIYGLLFMEMHVDQEKQFTESTKLIVNAFSELTALALANVRLRENLRYQSIRDPLTALYNRRYLEDFLQKQIHQSERAKNNLAVLILDLDHFKKINDTYGHDAGDICLKEIGRLLEGDIRMGDIASRYGGEEFVIVLYNTDLMAAKRRAENIRCDVSMLSIKYGAQHVGPITVSIGISIYPQHGLTIAELIDAADKALYAAKNSGRNKIIAYGEKGSASLSNQHKDG
ncbi:diguanylate cyclase [Legionella sp.]|uniref:sensor domain-containing diguanylate cyclase n=1 Tax=Legionella sp. TaxID=459 RepID=UPI00321F9475